jgi:tetratricopeptide (TPR) repeat protein
MGSAQVTRRPLPEDYGLSADAVRGFEHHLAQHQEALAGAKNRRDRAGMWGCLSVWLVATVSWIPSEGVGALFIGFFVVAPVLMQVTGLAYGLVAALTDWLATKFVRDPRPPTLPGYDAYREACHIWDVAAGDYQESLRRWEEEECRSQDAWREDESRRKEQYWLALTGKGPSFESAVAELFQGMGHQVKVEAGPGDEGVDLTLDGGACIVQCKAHGKPLGSPVLQMLLGARSSRRATRAILVTLRGVTDNGQKYAAKHDLEVWDVARLVAEYRQLHPQSLPSPPQRQPPERPPVLVPSPPVVVRPTTPEPPQPEAVTRPAPSHPLQQEVMKPGSDGPTLGCVLFGLSAIALGAVALLLLENQGQTLTRPARGTPASPATAPSLPPNSDQVPRTKEPSPRESFFPWLTGPKPFAVVTPPTPSQAAEPVGPRPGRTLGSPAAWSAESPAPQPTKAADPTWLPWARQHARAGNCLLALESVAGAASTTTSDSSALTEIADALISAGADHLTQGRWDLAKQCADAALRLKPEYEPAVTLLLSITPKQQAAEKNVQRAKASQLLWWARDLRSRQKYEDAAACLKEALALNPDLAEAREELRQLAAWRDTASPCARPGSPR